MLMSGGCFISTTAALLDSELIHQQTALHFGFSRQATMIFWALWHWVRWEVGVCGFEFFDGVEIVLCCFVEFFRVSVCL